MPLDKYLLFLPACFAMNLAFGPNNLLSVKVGSQYGMKAAVLSAGGRLIGFAILIVAAAIGMGALLMASKVIYEVVKWLGAIYLVWIGVKLLMAKADLELNEELSSKSSIKNLFRQEFLVAIGNPKAILIFTAFFPQFVHAEGYWLSFTVEGMTFLALEVIAVIIYSFIGYQLTKFVKEHNGLHWINKFSGVMMLAFGIRLIVF